MIINNALLQMTGQTDSESPDISIALRKVVVQEVEAYFAEHGPKWSQDVSLYDQIIQRMEEGMISAVMAYTAGNEARASRILGISRSTLRQRLALYGLEQES